MVMATFWFLLLGLLFVLYFALGGLNIGVGMSLPTYPVSARRGPLNALGPFFLGNEVWIVGAAGVLLAAFPGMESALFHALYPLILAIIAGLVAINAGVQLRSRPTKEGSRAAFDVLITVSAVVLAFGWGALLGNLLTGLPLGGGPVVLTGWFPAVTGLVMLLLALAHGSAYLAWRLPDETARKAAARRGALLAPLAGVALLAVVGLGFADAGVRRAVENPMAAVVLAAVAAVAAGVAGLALRTGRAHLAPVATGLAMALPVVIVGAALFPHILVSTGAGESLTVAAGAADGTTLRLLAWIAGPVVPLLMALQVFSWRLYRVNRLGTGYW
jgi:cytochrome d ubiquinol oxidase subunit II